MRSLLAFVGAAWLAAPAQAQVDLRAPEPQIDAVADALALETGGTMIVSTPSEAPCMPEPASRWRSVCIEERPEELYVLVRAQDGRTRDATLASSATVRAIAVVAASLLGELETLRARPGTPGRYADSERPPGAAQADRPASGWRTLGQIAVGASLFTTGNLASLGPTLGAALGTEAPFGLRVLAFFDGSYPIAISDDTNLWLARVGLEVGARIDLAQIALHVAARGSAGITPARFGEPRRYDLKALASGGGVIGLSGPVEGVTLLAQLCVEGMARDLDARPAELVTTIELIAEWR
jgi:hypothetical protein